MKHLTREEVQVERLLEATRTVAVLGATTRAAEATVTYLGEEGFEIFPVRDDLRDVAGVKSWAALTDIPGSVDLVLVLAGALDQAVVDHATAKGARAVWLGRGVSGGNVGEQAIPDGLIIVRDFDIVEEHRHTQRGGGQPRKRGVNVGGRRRARKEPQVDTTGWVEGGGGGSKGGGGGHAVLDEKKMVGKPRRSSRRR
jgi:predicted CoA-binding protein